MAVPRNRHSTSRRNKRRSHHAKSPANADRCECGDHPRLPHRACPCGLYNGRYVGGAKKEV